MGPLTFPTKMDHGSTSFDHGSTSLLVSSGHNPNSEANNLFFSTGPPPLAADPETMERLLLKADGAFCPGDARQRSASFFLICVCV